ncbi:phosphoglucosamine mutase [Candidatus Gastranaerophilus sp. (ex Termes propinquus)]|nr:phosphoglucosamine mutase [Candidatus Gastranaerophilus sp. (ex Termes propinquus)]
MANIEFGTDGFRAVIAEGFTFENVRRITCAVAKYLKHKNSTVLIGYDPRFMANKFANFCAELLKERGYKVILSSCVCPTPVLAYAATIVPNCGGAIMFTASHNGFEYLGMKFIPPYGGPATVEITDEIVANIDYDTPLETGGEVVLKNFAPEYFAHIEKLIDFKKIADAKLKIIYDGLFSASVGYFDKLLRTHKIEFEAYNAHHDPYFGGGQPEPIAKFMRKYKTGYVTVANDGDADRYGVIDELGRWVNPNVVMALLLRYLVKKGAKGKLVKTVGASGLLDTCAEKLGVKTVTVPVGFKWVGEAMRQNETILAGEDSGGLSIGGHIPEKDGLLASALILEMLSSEGKTLVELQNELGHFVGAGFITDRIDIKLKGDGVDAKIKGITDKFLSFDEIAGFRVKGTLLLDGVKLLLDDDKTWILMRKSGTEPLLRFYIESNQANKIVRIKDFIRNMAG